MSYAAFKMVHCPTGVDNCAAAYMTHSAGETDADSVALPGAELIASGGYWASTPRDAAGGSGLPPNLVITKANVVEVFYVRLLEGDDSTANGSNGAGNPETTPRGGLMGGLSYVKLELACHYRFINRLLSWIASFNWLIVAMWVGVFTYSRLGK
jgi:cleavage and polyadenylation specificity factor subunit 1